MNLLIDTHALLWWLSDDAELSSAARTSIGDPENVIYVSAATAWEISIKRSLGKLTAPGDLEAVISSSGMLELPITIAHAVAAGRLPNHHSDPFDRMLVAQAMLENLVLVTRDEHIARYQVRVIAA